MRTSERDDTFAENNRELFGKERKILPGSFFESREWRSWAACKRPKQETWDPVKATLALLQRTMAQVFQLQYQAEAAVLAVGSGAGAARRKRAASNLAVLETDARAKMADIDCRAKVKR